MRIENPLLALYSCTEYFSLARTFRTAWGEAVLMVKLFSVRIMNSLLAVYRDTDNFTLARTFKTVWVSTLLTGVVWRFMLNVKLLRKSWDGKRWV